MKVTQFCLVVLLAIMPVVVLAVPTSFSGWSTVMYHQCDSDLEFLPNVPLARTQIDMNLTQSILNTAFSFVKQRAACECPGYNAADFDLMLDPVTAWLNILDANTKNPTLGACLTNLFPRNFLLLSLLKVNLPNTCSYATWSSTGTCTLQMALPDIQVTVLLALKKCASGPMPAFSVDCSGTGCSTFLLPCSSNSDCGGMTCYNPYKGQDPFPTAVFNTLKSIGFYPSTVQAPGCFQAPATPSTISSQNDITTAVFSFLLSQFGISRTVTAPQFCGLNNLLNISPSGPLAQLTSAYWTTTPVTTGPLLCWQQPDQPQYNLTTIRYTNVQQTAFAAWNGMLPSGSAALSAPALMTPLENNYVVSSTSRRVVESTCSGQFSFYTFGTRLFAIKLPDLSTIVQFFGNLLFQMETCEVTPNFTLQQFMARFGVWTPLLHLLSLDPNADQTIMNNPVYADFRQTIYKTFVNKIANLPSSCSYAQYAKSGTCSFTWSGLNTYLNMDLTLQFTAAQCSTNNLMPSIAVDCVGKDCAAFLDGFKPCAQDSDCPSASMKCINLPNFVNSLNLGITINSDDWFDLYMAGDNINATNPCQQLPPDQRSSNVEQTCSGPNKFWNQITSSLMSVFGGFYSGTTVGANNYGSICMPPTANFNANATTTWANSLVTVVGNSVTINTLAAAQPAPMAGTSSGSPATPTPTPKSGSAAISPISSLVTFVLALAAILAVVLF